MNLKTILYDGFHPIPIRTVKYVYIIKHASISFGQNYRIVANIEAKQY